MRTTPRHITDSSPRFTVEDEDVPECEWEFYVASNGEHCPSSGTKVILDNDEVDAITGPVHIGHLCDTHISPAFSAMNEE